MKKFLILTVTTLLLLLLSTTAFAVSVELTIDDNMLYKREQGAIIANELDVAAYETEGRTMVPVRAIVESFGADVTWDEPTQKVGIKLGDTDITLTLNDEKAYVNGEEYILDVAAAETNGRTMVPVRFVSEALKYKVSYVDELRTVYITDEEPVVTVNGVDFNVDDVNAFLYSFDYSNVQGNVLDVVLENLKQFAIFSEEAKKLSIDSTEQYNMFLNDALVSGQQMHSVMFLSSYAKLAKLYSDSLVYTMSLYGSITDDMVEQKYRSDYVCAKHILLQTTDETGNPLSEEEAKKVFNKMKDIVSQLQTGADFDKLMNEHSEDPGTQANPNGYVFTKGMMVKEFEDAAYSLKIGEVSNIIETSYGYHIIKREMLPELTDALKNQIASAELNDVILDNYKELSNGYEITVHKTPEQIIELLVQ